MVSFQHEGFGDLFGERMSVNGERWGEAGITGGKRKSVKLKI
jgi:hypothetical protein